MFFGKSITFDQEELGEAALAATSTLARVGSEDEFIEKLKMGDAASFDDFVTRYTPKIFALLLRLTEDVEEARDLTQDTFLSSLKAIKTFRGEADLKTWLYRIAINESRNRFRWWKRRNRQSIVSLDSQQIFDQSVSETIADLGESPEDAVLRRERERMLRKALAELAANFREVIVLRDIEGMSYEEVASALGINIGTVKSRIARGREELRQKLRSF